MAMRDDVARTVTFDPTPVRVQLTRQVIRDTLKRVQAMLLTHRINGGERRLAMDQLCSVERDADGNKCGTAACIGGWSGILLTGYEEGASLVMAKMVELDVAMRGEDPLANRDKNPLYRLFYSFGRTKNYDNPRVAATAIQRYLDGKRNPWPPGVMPNKLNYKRAA